jgi:hypothetical protein
MRFLNKGGWKEVASNDWYSKELTPKDDIGVVDKVNEWSEQIVMAELEFILKPIGKFIVELIDLFISATYTHLPEIGGFLTIGAGLLIMVTGNVGKYLGLYVITLTGVIIWISVG